MKLRTLVSILICLCLTCVPVMAQEAPPFRPWTRAELDSAYDAFVADRTMTEKGLIVPVEGYLDLIDMGDETSDFGLTAMLKDAKVELIPNYDHSLLPSAPVATLNIVFEADIRQAVNIHTYKNFWYVLVEAENMDDFLGGVYYIEPSFDIFVVGAMAYFDHFA